MLTNLHDFYTESNKIIKILTENIHLMKIKNIDNFSLQDCEKFLKENPYSELTDAVRTRQKQIMDEMFRNNRKNDEARKQQIHSYEENIKWIDMAEFNEKKKYKNLSTVRNFVGGIAIICFLIFGFVIYYTNTEHRIYSHSNREQISYVTGIENLLLNCNIIHIPWASSDETFPTWDYYSIEGEVFIVIILVGFASIIALLIISILHSPLANKIYNIQDGDYLQKYRVIQNEHGKIGLCKIGNFKLKKILPFYYDRIFMIPDNSYICEKDRKVGIYNTNIRKMIVPVVYDDIYSITDESVSLMKDNQVHSFTHKGYRVVK